MVLSKWQHKKQLFLDFLQSTTTENLENICRDVTFYRMPFTNKPNSIIVLLREIFKILERVTVNFNLKKTIL